MSNQDIRLSVKKAGLRLWHVADCYGVSDVTFSKMLRKPLKGEKREKVLTAIEKAKKIYGEDAE